APHGSALRALRRPSRPCLSRRPAAHRPALLHQRRRHHFRAESFVGSAHVASGQPLWLPPGPIDPCGRPPGNAPTKPSPYTKFPARLRPKLPQHCRVSGVDIHGVPSTATAETEDIMAKQNTAKAEGRNLTMNPGDEVPPGTPGSAEAICRDCGG